MASVSFKRQLQTIIATYNADFDPGLLTESAGKVYLPMVFNDFDAPDITVTGCTLTSGATKIVGTAGAFDEVRVGDIITTTSTGSLTSITDVTVDNCVTIKDQNYVIYPDTLTSTTLDVRAGEYVTGGGIDTTAIVDRINYETRQIFLDELCTATGIQTSTDILTFEKAVVVTAVRKSDATANANEIDINTTVATTGSNSTVTIVPGAREAVAAVIRLNPISNTTGSRLNVEVGVSYLDGTGVKGSKSGFNDIDVTALNYISLGTFGFDADTFLYNARIPKPTSV